MIFLAHVSGTARPVASLTGLNAVELRMLKFLITVAAAAAAAIIIHCITDEPHY
jgi:hypothetical protein